MHEVDLVSGALLQAIDAANRAGAHGISRLTFGLRSEGHLTSETVRMLASALGRGTPAEDALVDCEIMPDIDGQPELALLSVDVSISDREG
ncbi:MAG: hypothetical protein JOZ65_12730 [Chloroflexi bacterium]|nr:hypothetical protein [Chloroflexota bacterium]